MDKGYQVTSVADSFNPFGLQVDDIVTSLNGQAIKSLDLNTLRSDLQGSASPSITLNVLRNGVDTTLNIMAFGGGDDDGGQFGGNINPPASLIGLAAATITLAAATTITLAAAITAATHLRPSRKPRPSPISLGNA